MEIRAIKPEELDAWTALCGTVFEKNPGYFHNHFSHDPWADCEGIFTAWDAGKPVSSVRVFTRRIYLEGEEVPMGGIGEVCTLPSHRGMGLSAALLRESVGYMESHSLPVSILFTDINGFYAKQGWFTIPQRYCAVELGEAGGTMRLRPLEAADAPRLAQLHARYSRRYAGAVVRNEQYWERWMTLGKCCRVLEDEQGIRAHISYEKNERGELCFRDYTGPEELLRPAFELAGKEEGARKLLEVPARMTGSESGFVESTSTMFRLNAPFSCGGERIDTAGKLARAAADFVFFKEDGF